MKGSVMVASVTVHISDGPSKFDLMFSLFEGNPVPRKKVRFKVDDEKSQTGSSIIEVAIIMVAQEDGSGESWLFEGYTREAPNGKVHGLYSTSTRQGWYARGSRYLNVT